MIKKLTISLCLLLGNTFLIAQSQTEEFIFSGTGDLKINLGRYKIGTAIHITTQITGSWAEDGGIYHIVGDWEGLPKVIYRGESSISNRLKFLGYLDNNSYVYLFAEWINMSPNKELVNIISMTVHSNGAFNKNNHGDFNNATELNNVLTVQSNTENIGIGTINPKAKLSVNGDIFTKELKVLVDIEQYPDFVFSNNYNLLPLLELDEYIKKNNHLPEIPKADEVTEGLNVGKMNVKLLQKVEELTLYTIEQQKQIDKLEKIVLELQDINKFFLENFEGKK